MYISQRGEEKMKKDIQKTTAEISYTGNQISMLGWNFLKLYILKLFLATKAILSYIRFSSKVRL